MPRPRRDSEILPAKERMENAFWELLADREYRKITVTDIVRAADVNRNSFYYHYSGLPELADSAIMHTVQNTHLAFPTPNSDPDEMWRKNVITMLRTSGPRERLDRLALLAGPHSSPALIDSLRDFGRLTMISTLQLDPDHLDLKTDLMLDFTVGGMLSVLRRWPELSNSIELEDLLKEDVAVLAMGLYLSMSKTDMRGYWHRIFRDDVRAIGGSDGQGSPDEGTGRSE
ncbi:TetR/AcrR family transcriptional regulator [Bifidobacterium scardovii]|uniref:TetR/AcrR family transcriptional regulator n=1 Tax=Bifidobacterium scardovii TaxID=158787 RepID=UPI0009E50187|nr:TetR/AcrR family transcriptional regulator [Bifidobacterium scardovii]MDU3736788.1 TetR/AcrR family transcriptional regulator [Bifidobacterium scardovii]MDU5296165.1 TetR/AcrR family transcriptional regulator [Bifidobacterium scardovii]MDU5610795.1 TetR/AcrR family transcriptional regulator [Bifidobacterium scardovii]MDU5886019.1 TetR/AcrR family transcriptional regulator [Bifidobacterium scardovii]